MSRGMTKQRDELHAVDDWLRATKRVPLTGLDIRRCDGLRTLEERLRILWRLSSDFGRQPKIAFSLRDVDIGIWKDARSVLSGEAADMIGMEVRDQNDVDFFRRVACAAEAAHQAPDCSPTIPGAGGRIEFLLSWFIILTIGELIATTTIDPAPCRMSMTIVNQAALGNSASLS